MLAPESGMTCVGGLSMPRRVALEASPAMVSSTDDEKAAGRPLAFSAEESIH